MHKEINLSLFSPLAPSHPETSSMSLERLPLAYRMRPQRLADFFGQEHVLGTGKPLSRWIQDDRVPPLLLWGPPGCGKTTLAQIIAHKTQAQFKTLSAVEAGIKEIKEAVFRAKELKKKLRKKTLLFVDEIHRFNRSQQDALLPYVEDGTLTLIGATTENPSYELNSALLSRMQTITLRRLSESALTRTIQHALIVEKGLNHKLKIKEDAVQFIAQIADGDARRALGLLESIALQVPPNKKEIPLKIGDIQKILEELGSRSLPIAYDQKGEEHYNVISAFIKSIRDSDPHAGIYYLARMLAGGEDPLFIARRLVILASEDIGNADPNALQVALNVKEAVDFVGMPEARICLAQGVTYLSLAPKSNASYEAIEAALKEVEKTGSLPVPPHLRNGVNSFMKKEGYGKSYIYAHSTGSRHVRQSHLPDCLLKLKFYFPKEAGEEIQAKQRLDALNPDFE